MLSTLASRAAAMRPLLMARGPVVGARGIYMQVRGDQDPERLLSRLSGISSEDGLMKERQRRRFHEKGTQRRKRARSRSRRSAMRTAASDP
jgi:ribosomal protein S21